MNGTMHAYYRCALHHMHTFTQPRPRLVAYLQSLACISTLPLVAAVGVAASVVVVLLVVVLMLLLLRLV